MPGFDRTGPQGQGARTGRAMGLCGPGAPAQFGGGFGMGRGRGGAFGRGRGRGMGGRGFGVNAGFIPTQPAWTAQDEKTYLANRADALEAELAEVKQALSSFKDEGDANNNA